MSRGCYDPPVPPARHRPVRHALHNRLVISAPGAGRGRVMAGHLWRRAMADEGKRAGIPTAKEKPLVFEITPEQQTVLAEAITHYGRREQLLKVAEELQELADECHNAAMGRGNEQALALHAEPDRTCMTCKYEYEAFDRWPCRACDVVFASRWEPKSEVMP